MRQELIDRIKEQIRYEFGRKATPEGFPKFPDIPGGRYTSQEFYDLEQKYMWPRTWLYAGRQEELPKTGSYCLWDSSGVPVILVRDDEDRIRAFVNRSPNEAPLVPYHDDSHLVHNVPFDAPGELFVQQVFPRRELPDGVLRCQRKGWTYDLSGKLVGLPSGELMENVSYDKRQLSEYRCEIFDGFIFVNRDPRAEPLLTWLGPVVEEWKQFDCETLRMFSRTTVVQKANWKVVTEAFQEVYHFKHIHQHDGITMLDQRGACMGLLPNGHSRMIVPFTKRLQRELGMESPTDWREGDANRGGLVPAGVMPELPNVVPMVKRTSTAFSLFPNLVTPQSANGFPFLLAWPMDPGHTLFEWTMFMPDWGEDNETIEALRKSLLATPNVVMEEDTRNLEPMFKSLSSPGMRGIHVGYQERRIYYSAEVLDRIIGPERIPQHLRVQPLLEDYVEK